VIAQNIAAVAISASPSRAGLPARFSTTKESDMRNLISDKMQNVYGGGKGKDDSKSHSKSHSKSKSCSMSKSKSRGKSCSKSRSKTCSKGKRKDR
jgi:hypothetical protein